MPTTIEHEQYISADSIPTWLLAEQAFPELEENARLRAAQQLGGIALLQECAVEEMAETIPNQSTLLAAIQEAKLGDASSCEVVKRNVAMDVVERMYKAGHQTRVPLQVIGGELSQNDRALSDIHRNTLLHTVLNEEMYQRTKIELKNALLFEELITTGVHKTHNAVVFSLTPEDEKTRHDYGFFTDTDTCSVQFLRVDGSSAIFETAMVAGKKTPQSTRHDLEAIQGLAAHNGLQLKLADARDTLRHVMLVPKDMAGGVEDIVEQYDHAAGGTFYGESLPRRDYKAYAQECYARNEGLEETIERVTKQLLSEAHILQTPFEAIERLDYLSERFCVKHSVSDGSIRAAVFGAESAAFIEQARMLQAMGDNEAAESAMRKAQETASSGSCPLFKNSKDQELTPNSPKSEEEKSKKKWMSCPHCNAKVYDDPCANFLACWDCKAMVINGKVVSTGNGGKHAREVTKIESKPSSHEVVKAPKAEPVAVV